MAEWGWTARKNAKNVQLDSLSLAAGCRDGGYRGNCVFIAEEEEEKRLKEMRWGNICV